MFSLIRAVTYAALLVALVLVFLPADALSWSGIARPAIHVPQVVGMAVGVGGS